jgi:hypothetical protein
LGKTGIDVNQRIVRLVRVGNHQTRREMAKRFRQQRVLGVASLGLAVNCHSILVCYQLTFIVPFMNL